MYFAPFRLFVHLIHWFLFERGAGDLKFNSAMQKLFFPLFFFLITGGSYAQGEGKDEEQSEGEALEDRLAAAAAAAREALEAKAAAAAEAVTKAVGRGAPDTIADLLTVVREHREVGTPKMCRRPAVDPRQYL